MTSAKLQGGLHLKCCWSQAANDAATELALTHYRDCIRSCLNSSSGYECQEADGDFMLAFANNNDAVIFSLMVLPPSATEPAKKMGKVLLQMAGHLPCHLKW